MSEYKEVVAVSRDVVDCVVVLTTADDVAVAGSAHQTPTCYIRLIALYVHTLQPKDINTPYTQKLEPQPQTAYLQRKIHVMLNFVTFAQYTNV